MLSKRKDGSEAAGRRNLRVQLVLERITGVSQEDGYQSAAMQHGVEREEAALCAYEALTGSIVTRTGFLSCDDLMAGCSLDGHHGDFESIVEAKAPLSATHLEYLRAKRVPPEYVPQITHDIWVSGAKWVQFASFDDRFPEELQLFVVRAYCEEFDIAAYEVAVRKFLTEVDRETEAVRAMMRKAAA